MPKYDTGKTMYSLIEPAFSEDLAKVLTMGAQKYGPENWKFIDNAIPRYYDALMRHLEAWRQNEEIDEESGLPHLAHAAANIMFLHYLDGEEKLYAESVSTEGEHNMGESESSSECDNCCRADHEKEPSIRFWIYRAD